MGSVTSIPLDSPLGCILRNWKEFDADSLKEKRLIFFCNTGWPQYKLGDHEQWPLNGMLNYITILKLDLYYWRLGKDSEVPYVQAFMAL
ncbi:hypothetical protein DBR06_SOUSAS11210004, partial [Sousa chinensis]